MERGWCDFLGRAGTRGLAASLSACRLLLIAFRKLGGAHGTDLNCLIFEEQTGALLFPQKLSQSSPGATQTAGLVIDYKFIQLLCLQLAGKVTPDHFGAAFKPSCIAISSCGLSLSALVGRRPPRLHRRHHRAGSASRKCEPAYYAS